jgi:Flp pilus assembly protein TadD
LGDIHQAIVNLPRAAEIRPTRSLPYDLRRSAYAKLGEDAAVAADFAKALALHPGYNVYLHKELAINQMFDAHRAYADQKAKSEQGLIF